jgi:hypothetical protein
MSYDTAGRRVDRGAPYHPDGREELVAVGLRHGLAGRIVARYCVISEDGQPVARRTAFPVKRLPRERDDAMEGPGAGGGAPMAPTEDDHALTGQVTEVAFAASRGSGYLAIALATGGVVLLLLVWLPAVARWAKARAEWRAVSERFVGRLWHVLLGAVIVGLLSTLLEGYGSRCLILGRAPRERPRHGVRDARRPGVASAVRRLAAPRGADPCGTARSARAGPAPSAPRRQWPGTRGRTRRAAC